MNFGSSALCLALVLLARVLGSHASPWVLPPEIMSRVIIYALKQGDLPLGRLVRIQKQYTTLKSVGLSFDDFHSVFIREQIRHQDSYLVWLFVKQKKGFFTGISYNDQAFIMASQSPVKGCLDVSRCISHLDTVLKELDPLFVDEPLADVVHAASCRTLSELLSWIDSRSYSCGNLFKLAKLLVRRFLPDILTLVPVTLPESMDDDEEWAVVFDKLSMHIKLHLQ